MLRSLPPLTPLAPPPNLGTLPTKSRSKPSRTREGFFLCDACLPACRHLEAEVLVSILWGFSLGCPVPCTQQNLKKYTGLHRCALPPPFLTHIFQPHYLLSTYYSACLLSLWFASPPFLSNSGQSSVPAPPPRPEGMRAGENGKNITERECQGVRKKRTKGSDHQGKRKRLRGWGGKEPGTEMS